MALRTKLGPAIPTRQTSPPAMLCCPTIVPKIRTYLFIPVLVTFGK
jgi:hypothetical protein